MLSAETVRDASTIRSRPGTAAGHGTSRTRARGVPWPDGKPASSREKDSRCLFPKGPEGCCAEKTPGVFFAASRNRDPHKHKNGCQKNKSHPGVLPETISIEARALDRYNAGEPVPRKGLRPSKSGPTSRTSSASTRSAGRRSTSQSRSSSARSARTCWTSATTGRKPPCRSALRTSRPSGASRRTRWPSAASGGSTNSSPLPRASTSLPSARGGRFSSAPTASRRTWVSRRGACSSSTKA